MNETKLAPAEPPANRLPILLAVVFAAMLVVFGLLVPIPFSGRVAIAIGDCVHAPLFGGVTLGVLAILQRLRPLTGLGKPLAIRCVLVALVTFVFGVVIELLQSNFGRSATLHDAVANGLGILAAIFWYVARQIERHRPARVWLRRSLLLTCGFLLGIAWWSPVMMLRDVAALRSDFPTLASFESRAQLQRFYFRECSPKLTRQDATDGKYAMEVTFQDTPYPAATLIEMVPDWSKMWTLELDVVVDESYPGQELRFLIQVIDEINAGDDGDTYRQEWILTPGQPKHIRIPRDQLVNGPDTRPLDLTQIKYVDLTVLEPGQSVALRFDAIRLTIK